MKQTEVRFFHKGDSNYEGTVLYIAKSKKAAREYIKNWLNAHTTKTYKFTYKGFDRWESNFTAIYLA